MNLLVKSLECFSMFLKDVSYAHQSCMYLIQNAVNKNSNIVKYFYNLK